MRNVQLKTKSVKGSWKMSIRPEIFPDKTKKGSEHRAPGRDKKF